MFCSDTIKNAIVASVPGESERALVEQVEISEDKGMFFVVCPNAFSHRCLSRQYRDTIISSISGVVGRPVDVDFCIRAEKKTVHDKGDNREAPVQMTLPYQASSSCGLISGYTFDEFIVGRCNAFAFEAAMAVAEDDISRYNPLYFYSDIGLGKSHIAHAIGNKLRGSKKAVKVRYTTARDFSSDFVNSIRNNCLNSFEKTYSASGLDLFFIDDVHLFKNKEKTQMELSHIMDDLISAGKQVILSGFRPPSSMTQIDKGLCSRFSSGLVIDIKKPDRDTRMKMIRHKAKKNGLVLPEEVAELLSSTVVGNVRELDSAVLTIAAMSSLMKRPVTMDLVREILEGTLEKQKEITIEFIQNFIAKNFCISKEKLLSPSRKKDVVYPRQVAIYLSRRYTSDTLQGIGDAFSRKHSSVIHSLETVETMYKENLKTKKEIDFLIEKLETEAGR